MDNSWRSDSGMRRGRLKETHGHGAYTLAPWRSEISPLNFFLVSSVHQSALDRSRRRRSLRLFSISSTEMTSLNLNDELPQFTSPLKLKTFVNHSNRTEDESIHRTLRDRVAIYTTTKSSV